MANERKHTDSARPNVQSALKYGGAIIFWIVLWAAIAVLVGNPILVAGPGETLGAFFGSFTQPAFWSAIAQTTVRIVCVGLASALVATVLGFVAARFSWVRVLLAPAIQVMKSAPVACIIVIVLVAAGAVGALVSIVAFVTIPPFYVAALEAQGARNDATERILRLAGLSAPRVFLASTWPSMLPFFSAAAKTAIGLSWKAGITAELLCIPLGSIGAAVYGAKLTLDTPALLMWTIVVMLLGWVNEKLAVALLDATRKTPDWAVKRAVKQRTRDESDSARAIDPATNDARTIHSAACETCSSATSETRLSVARGVHPAAELALDDVRFGYSDTLVLNDLCLRVIAGERICLMAPTGTGKTTLISLLLDGSRTAVGSVSRPDRLGIVLQHNTLVESLSALQNVLLVCGDTSARQEERPNDPSTTRMPHDIPSSEQAADAKEGRALTERIERELDSLLPEGCTHKATAELSGGTRRLVEIARAMLAPNEAIIMDEPFTGLDEETNERACAFILKHLGGRPLLFTTHHAEDAKRLDAQIITLEEGRTCARS